ncbi:MAG: ggt 1 [Burkholderiaceae bacterium]|nr:ggt 1 [Burkholderiaceae bacterium]
MISPMPSRIAALCCALLLAACASAPERPSAPEAASGFRPGLQSTTAQRHMAAAANPLAAEAGREMLREGGSAVDAAIAMQMVLTLVEPQSSGIGGGAFLLHFDGRRVQAYDGRETAPLAAEENLFMAGGKPMAFHDAAVGGRSVGTPGVLRMLEAAHRQHGRLAWARLFEPAIRLADEGFPVSPRLHALLNDEKFLARDPAARAYFYDADGAPKAVGTVLRNPPLAATLRAIAGGGADAFYRGEIAAEVVRIVSSHPNAGRLAAADLAAYQAKERTPVCTDYKRWRVCGMPPPSSGGIAVAQMLGIFAVRNIAVVPPVDIGGQLQPQVDAVHLFSEAGRLAFADRNLYVADPDFIPVDWIALTNPRYLADRAKLIGDRSMRRAAPGVPAGYRVAWAADESQRIATSHISAVDGFGNAVSMTTSIEDAFGARLMVRGFLLNNQLTDFSFLPSEDGKPIANRVQPGKRPRSSMAPTLVFDRASGEMVAALGSPGGSQIIGYVARTLVGVLDWDLDIQQAISLANFGSRNGPTEVEQGRVGRSVIEGLQARGHEVGEIPMTSGLQGIVRVRLADGHRGWAGGADPRREGVALGD